MGSIPVTETLSVVDREQWRDWLRKHHKTKKEIWLVYYAKKTDKPSIPYLHAVEEALCFGWIDGIAKKLDDDRSVQRFTPRRAKSHWTELNKERARRLSATGRMTEAGRRVLPDLSEDSFHIPGDILNALQEDKQVWENFQKFPASYQRIRVGYIEEMRKQPDVFKKRLANFLSKTQQGKMFGQRE